MNPPTKTIFNKEKNMIARHLRNASVLALILGLFLADATRVSAQTTRSRSSTRSSSSRSGSSTREYNSNGMIGDAMISSDPETRRIIVITDEETNEHISQVVTNMDRPKPQVLIKVVFLEVTHNDGSDIGVEGSYTHKISNSTTGTVSTLFGGLAQETTGGFYKVMSDDFQVTLRAIQTAGKTEVLSRPSILARNNQLATITVGQEIPIITATRLDINNNPINTISYEDIGIILRVTPFITSDGMVEMIVSPEISSLTDQKVPIASNVSAPVISKRAADTVVVTPDGLPVVIGGLMQNQKIASTKKVPLLGDIPGLGYLFRRKETSDTKTELIMILVPHIVMSPSQLASMSDHERKQNEMAPKAFSEKELDRYIDTLPVKKENVPGTGTAAPADSKKSSGKVHKSPKGDQR
jgi:general secretion pathway protein D